MGCLVSKVFFQTVLWDVTSHGDLSDPVQGATSSTIGCNDDGNPGSLQLTATWAAGSQVTAYWNQVWPHNTGPVVSAHTFYDASCITC
jgi:hypothetical protein